MPAAAAEAHNAATDADNAADDANRAGTLELPEADTTAPDAPVITGIVDETGDYSQVTMHGTGSEPDNTITLYDESGRAVATTEVGDDGSWSIDISALPGTGVNDNEFFRATETDGVGNVSAASETAHYWHGTYSNAATESSDDFVLTGAGDDRITIAADDSNDALYVDSGSGNDTVVFSGNRADYTVVENEDGSLSVTTPGGDVTVLENVENFRFDDNSYDTASLLDTAAERVDLSFDIGAAEPVYSAVSVVDNAANAEAGIYERGGSYFQMQESDQVDVTALRELGYTIDSDGHFFIIDEDRPKTLVEQELTRDVTRVVDAEPMMMTASETTTYTALGDEHIEAGGAIARRDSQSFDFEEPTSNIEIEFENFDSGTSRISFYDAEGNQLGDTIHQSHTNGARGYAVPEGAAGVTVENWSDQDNFTVESLSYRGPSSEVTVEAGGLIPDLEAMEAAGITWSETESQTLVQSADITDIGDVGNNQVDGFNPEDHELSQVFDFGAELANRQVSITVEMEVKGSWDNNATSTNDYFSVSANGQEVDVNYYSSNNRTWSYESEEVTTISGGGTTVTYEYDVYLDENGQVQLDFMVASTATDEVVNVRNIEVAYEGQSGWVREVTETETYTQSVLVDAPAQEVAASEIPGGVPMMLQEVEVAPIMTEQDVITGYEYPVDITAASTDADGSELLSAVTLDGLPDGSRLAGAGIDGNSVDLTLLDANDPVRIASDRELGADELEGVNASITSTEIGGDTLSTTAFGEGDDVFAFGGDTEGAFDLGEGFDTLVVTEPTVDFGAIGSEFSGVEQIDLTQSGQNSIRLNVEDVLDMTGDTEDHTIRITGTDEDEVDLNPDEWTQGESTEEGFTNYTANDDPTVTLQIQDDINIGEF